MTTMPALINLIGQRFGRLIVTNRAENNKHGKPVWKCLCDCGERVKINGYELRKGDTKSCGCLLKDFNHEKSIRLKQTSKYLHHERLYRVWASMIQRCSNPKVKEFKDYGGRGITVCNEWFDYEAFRTWALSHGYNPSAPRGECTLDRIEVDGPYAPWNCRWADLKTQANNKRIHREKVN